MTETKNILENFPGFTACPGEWWQPNAQKGRPFVCSSYQLFIKRIFICRIILTVIPISAFLPIPILSLVTNILFFCAFKLDSNQAYSGGMAYYTMSGERIRKGFLLLL